jgi:single-stranded-DNA-specific exonuclease
VIVSLKPKRWRINPPIPLDERDRFQDFHPLLAQILYRRGFTDAASARSFLNGTPIMRSPREMKGIDEAGRRIREAIRRREKIVVYGDFDADGVTSTVVLVSALKALGADVEPYIPNRIDEGYGLNIDALDRIKYERKANVVVTVDCGIRSLREVEHGCHIGLDMIVTDHHSVGPELPQCTAVINPKQPGCNYGEPMLAGVGVAYRLAQWVLATATANDRITPTLQAESLLDLVAIGTVADLAPLDKPENRALVIDGLKLLRRAQRPGVRALLDVSRMAPEKVDAMAIGFTIGPRINAAGRLASADLAYELLSTDDPALAMERAQELQALNVQRQDFTREAQDFARRLAGIEPGADVPLIFAADPTFREGIVGLVAGRLAEEFYRPSIVIHRGEAESHGSCRSIPEFNITAALDQCAELLIRHGGHAQAAGFALHNENLPSFQERIYRIAAESLHGQDLAPSLEIDAEVRLHDVDEALYAELRRLEPTGNSMPAPILCANRVRVVEKRTVGRDEAHLKLRFMDGYTIRNAIGFRMGPLAGDVPEYVDVAFQAEPNEYNGHRSIELKVMDMRPAG